MRTKHAECYHCGADLKNLLRLAGRGHAIGINPCGLYARGGRQMAKNRARFPSNAEHEDDGHVKLELMMDNAAASCQGTCGASSFDADEWVEGSKPREGPEPWPEWKQENDQAYQQYLDEACNGDLD
jgi:hypothetical protein